MIFLQQNNLYKTETLNNRSKKVDIKTKLTSLNGIEVDSQIIFVEAFKYIKQEVKIRFSRLFSIQHGFY